MVHIAALMKMIALAWRLDVPLDPTLAILTIVKGAPIVRKIYWVFNESTRIGKSHIILQSDILS